MTTDLEPNISDPDLAEPNISDPDTFEPDVNNPDHDNLQGTVFSPAFRFVEWRAYVATTGNFSDWGPDADFADPATPGAPPYQELERKWIYVFRDLCDVFDWHGEFYAERPDSLRPVRIEGFENHDRDDRPAPAAAIRKLRLPHTINGNPAFYYAFASRIRLPIDAIQQIITDPRARQILPCLSLKISTYDANPELRPNRLQWSGTEWLLAAVDPLTIALNLADSYRDACDHLIAFNTKTTAVTLSDRLKVRERCAKKIVGQVVKSMVDSGPELAAKLKPLLKGGSTAAIEAFLEKDSAEQRLRSTEVDLRAAQLCYWLTGNLFQITQAAHFINESWDAAAFISVFGQSIERLIESSPGKVYLTTLFESPSHFVHVYALPQFPASDAVFQVGRKCSAAIMTVWKEFAPVVMKDLGPKAAEYLARALSHISRTDDLRTIRRVFRTGPDSWRPSRRTLEITYTAFADINKFEKTALAQWITAGEGKVKSVEKFFVGVEIFNLGFSVVGLAGAGLDVDGAFSVLGFVGSSADLYSAVRAAFPSAADIAKRLAKVGFISAIIDMVTAFKDMAKMAGRHDYDAMVGYGFVAMGSGLVAWGQYLTWTAAATASSGVGVPPAVIAGVIGAAFIAGGILITTFLSHSDLEVFVNHCFFGKNAGSGGATAWSSGPMSEWNWHPHRQVDALFFIISGIELESSPFTPTIPGVKVKLGMVHEKGRLFVDVSAKYTDGSFRRAIIRFDMWTHEMDGIFGDAIDQTRHSVQLTGDERYVIIGAQFLSPPPDCDTFAVVECAVHFDYYGDGEYTVPKVDGKLTPLKLQIG
jgi:hypothetical protein